VRRVPLRLLLFALLAGCYTNVPLAGSRPEPVPGTRLVIEFTDRGRAGLAGQLGSEAVRVEGALVSRSDTAYEVRVSAVMGLWGTLSRWQGERVTLPTEYIRVVSERRFSMGRTLMAASTATAGFLLFAATRSLLGGGVDAGPGPDPLPPSGT